MSGFARSFGQAFSQGMPMGFNAGAQHLKEQLLRSELDERKYNAETTGLAAEAAADARAAPIYESEATTAPNAAGQLETKEGPAPVRPGKKAPAWVEMDALRAQAQVLGSRGQQELAARLMAQADTQFETHMKRTSDSMLRAVEAGDFDTAFKMYDEAVPDGQRLESWKQEKDGSISATLLSADGEPVKWKGGVEELRQLAVGITNPAAIAKMRDEAMDREGQLFTRGIGAAFQGNNAFAEKILGGPVKITDITNAEGVKDQQITLPTGQVITRSNFEKVAPWAMQEFGDKRRKTESDLQTAAADRGLKGAQAGYYGAATRQADAGAAENRAQAALYNRTDPNLRAGSGSGKKGEDAFSETYFKWRKDIAPTFENDTNLPNKMTPQAATDQLAHILTSAELTGLGGKVMPMQIISAMRSGSVRLDPHAQDENGRTVPVWQITDPATNTRIMIPAVGVAPGQPAPPGPVNASGTALEGAMGSGLYNSLPSQRGSGVTPGGLSGMVVAP